MSNNFTKKYAWPDGFDLREEPEIGEKIRSFIEAQLQALKEYDQKRRDWVKENLPADYKMTYFFYEHAYKVAEDIKKTATLMELSDLVAENLYWAMLAHDIGKTKLPLHLWDMVEKPEDDVKALRRTHTEEGIKIIDEELNSIDHPFIDLMKDIILHHHEQMDGNGFLGLNGDRLSAPVRLACIIESFDGYQTPRPHFGERDVSTEGVLKRMREEKGEALYDMELFEAFAKMKMSNGVT